MSRYVADPELCYYVFDAEHSDEPGMQVSLYVNGMIVSGQVLSARQYYAWKGDLVGKLRENDSLTAEIKSTVAERFTEKGAEVSERLTQFEDRLREYMDSIESSDEVDRETVNSLLPQYIHLTGVRIVGPLPLPMSLNSQLVYGEGPGSTPLLSIPIRICLDDVTACHFGVLAGEQ